MQPRTFFKMDLLFSFHRFWNRIGFIPMKLYTVYVLKYLEPIKYIILEVQQIEPIFLFNLTIEP